MSDGIIRIYSYFFKIDFIIITNYCRRIQEERNEDK